MLLFDCFAWVHNKLVSEPLVKAWEELCSCFFGYGKIVHTRCSGKCLNEAFVVILTLLSLEMPKEDVWWF